MKSLSYLTCAALLLCGACKKIRVQDPTVSKIVTTTNSNQIAEDLGNPLKGNNVSWKINPLSPGSGALITYAPNTTGGYCALMLDNGLLNGATPINAFRFISANLQNNTSKIVEIKSKATGLVSDKSLGRLTAYCFGMNKKFYIATEAGFEDGGHLIEYDPNTQTALDLGRPFLAEGRYLNIYSLNVGSDGALYGGSFGGNGDVYTFRYDYTNFYVDKTRIDEDAKYVSYVSGDARYTYASVGQNNWKLYAIDRTNGVKTLLMQSANPVERIEIATHNDAPYAKLIATHFRLSGPTATSLGAYNRPSTPRLYFTPYELDNASLPEVVWNSQAKKVTYKFPGAAEASVTVAGVVDDIYPTGALLAYKNTVFLNSTKVPEFASYSRAGGFKSLGNTSVTVHCMAVAPDNSNTVSFAGYPKGFLMQYKLNQPWTINTTTTNYIAPDMASSQSNPQKIAQFQDADAAGVFGAMLISGMNYTKNGYLVVGGNNDRLTASTNRELSFSSYKNGVKRNMYLPEFENYEFTGMCLSQDSTLEYIAAEHKYGGKGRIYTYNPATNTVVNSVDVSLGTSAGKIALFKDGFVAGIARDQAYIINIKTDSIVWKQQVGNCFAMLVAPDKTMWVNYPSGEFSSTLSKFNFTLSSGVPVAANMTVIAQINDAHRDTNTKPQEMVFVETNPNCYDMYISGLKSLYRVNNCMTL